VVSTHDACNSSAVFANVVGNKPPETMASWYADSELVGISAVVTAAMVGASGVRIATVVSAESVPPTVTMADSSACPTTVPFP